MVAALSDAAATGRRRRWRRWPTPLIVGGLIVVVLVVVAALAQYLAPFPYDQMHVRDRLQGPSLKYLAGTDEYGRDVFSRLLFGSQLSIALGGVATLVSMVFGVPLGLFAGYRPGMASEVIMRGLDVMMSFPPIMLVLLILAVTPPSLMKTALAIGVLFVPPIARVVRSVTIDLMSEDFLEAARSRGERTWYILLRELLPNVWPVLMVEASLRVVFCHPARCGAEFSWFRRAAAVGGLGADDQQRAREFAMMRRGSRWPRGLR